MTPSPRTVAPLLDLSGWDRLPDRHEPLAGQQNLFDLATLTPFVPRRNIPLPLGGLTELFDSGRDLPGAAEREQRIIWDVA